jgi:hypothetical protein
MTRGTIQREHVYVYDTCMQCQEQNVLVYECGEQLLCAEHSRQYARKNPLPQYCDRCGKQDKVVRDPGHRRNEYLCMSCHADDGFLIHDSVTARAVKSALELPTKEK